LRELMELGRGSAPTVFHTQFRKKPSWRAGATMKHIVYNAAWLYMGEGSTRKMMAERGM